MVNRSAKWKLRSREKCFMRGRLTRRRARGASRACKAVPEAAPRQAFPSTTTAAKNAAFMGAERLTQGRQSAALRPSNCVAAIATVMVLAGGASAQPATAPLHISMEALHAAGGVPPGWQMALRPGDVQGGRQLFFEQGCHTCHVVQGANLPAVTPEQRRNGPELTGMGKHHPPLYFLESIVNPSAVVV